MELSTGSGKGGFGDKPDSGINLTFDDRRPSAWPLPSQEFAQLNTAEAPLIQTGGVPSFKTTSESVSRWRFKQELMRTQVAEEEARERGRAAEFRPPIPSLPVKTERPIVSSVPNEVLEVKSLLQNPTKYHVKQQQLKQVEEYLSGSEGGGWGGFTELTTLSAPPALTASVGSGSLDDESVVEDILSMESGEPESVTDILARLQCGQQRPEIVRRAKDRQKKDNHNIIERKRRVVINNQIQEIRTLLPRTNDRYYEEVGGEVKASKGMTLKAAVEYIRLLKADEEARRSLESRYKALEQQNRRQALRIQELERGLEGGGDNATRRPFPNLMDEDSDPMFGAFENMEC